MLLLLAAGGVLLITDLAATNKAGRKTAAAIYGSV